MVGIPFDIPIFITHVPQGHSREARHQGADELSTNSPPPRKQITEAEKANGIFGTGLQAKSGHYSLECDWTQAVWGHGGSIFGADKKFKGNDEQGIKGLEVVSGAAEERAAERRRRRPGTASSR